MTTERSGTTRLGEFLKRNRLKTRKAIWRTLHDHSPLARAVFILGAQRSGTTMLIQCLEQSMEFEVFGESSSAMVQYRIRDNDYVTSTVRKSHHPFVVFKPLTDSHRASEFLDLIPGSSIVWVFRRVEDRVNSSVAKFGDHNLQILRGIVRGEGLERWQAQGLIHEDIELIRRHDPENMSPHVASAIFWYLRNSLFFKQGLDLRGDVLPLCYEDLASDPPAMMRGVCRLLGAEFDPAMVSGIHGRSIGRSESKLPSNITELCTPLYDRLHMLQKARWDQSRLLRAA